ncbi:MAG: anti-sigma factor family protein, partial [bacterium]
MRDEHVREQLAAYALDALDPEEARIVADHLRTCAGCREELVGLRAVSDALAAAAPAVSPPAALRQEILDAVRPLPRRARQWWKPSWVPVAAAATALVLAVALVSVNQQMRALQERLAVQERAVALLTAPSARTVELTGNVQASVRFVFDPARQEGALIVT